MIRSRRVLNGSPTRSLTAGYLLVAIATGDMGPVEAKTRPLAGDEATAVSSPTFARLGEGREGDPSLALAAWEAGGKSPSNGESLALNAGEDTEEDAVAAALSAILPGTGQVYKGKFVRGPLLAAAIGGAFYFGVGFLNDVPDEDSYGERTMAMSVAVMLLVSGALMYVANIYDASSAP